MNLQNQTYSSRLCCLSYTCQQSQKINESQRSFLASSTNITGLPWEEVYNCCLFFYPLTKSINMYFEPTMSRLLSGREDVYDTVCKAVEEGSHVCRLLLHEGNPDEARSPTLSWPSLLLSAWTSGHPLLFFLLGANSTSFLCDLPAPDLLHSNHLLYCNSLIFQKLRTAHWNNFTKLLTSHFILE